MKTSWLKFNSYKEEQNHIKTLRKERPFLIKNGYVCDVPKSFNNEVYVLNKEKYRNKLNKLAKKWSMEEKKFFKKLECFFGRKINTSIKINFTAYGPGGHYNLEKKKIIIKINSPYDPIFIIKHEIIHLLVEAYMIKYKIRHKDKEKIVDSILDVL